MAIFYWCINTKTEAQDALHRVYVEVKDGRNKNSGNYTVVGWLEHWLEKYMKNSIKQSTYASYVGYIKKHFEPSFGKCKLCKLTAANLQEFYNYKYESGLSPKTLRNINMFLHKALAQACKENLIATNVSECVELPKRVKPEITVLTVEQQQKLISASYEHRYGVFVRLALATGLRLGELLGLRWQDVDIVGKRLYVRQTLNRLRKYDTSETENVTDIVFGTPKSENSKRMIPLLPIVISDLKAWKKVQEKDRNTLLDRYIESDLVVTNEYGKYIELVVDVNPELSSSAKFYYTLNGEEPYFRTRYTKKTPEYNFKNVTSRPANFTGKPQDGKLYIPLYITTDEAISIKVKIAAVDGNKKSETYEK